MKLILFFLFLFSSTVYAQDKQINSIEDSINLNTELGTVQTKINQSFSLRSIFESQQALENFIVKNISIIKPSSPEDVSHFIQKGTQNLFIKDYTKDTPLFSEFTFRALNEPQAIAKFLSLFMKINYLIIFSIIMILTIVLSHFLGELKYRFPVLSFKRISYSLFRFTVVNGIRIWTFSYLFLDHVKPISQVYYSSLISVQDQYPLLYNLSSFLFEQA